MTMSMSMSGSESQVEWAQRIKYLVGAEFERVAEAFRSVALRQSGIQRADTEAILKILEEKRGTVMSRDEAGYFIRDWQEISDQVRKMISQDSRFQAIKASRPSLKIRKYNRGKVYEH
jgi:hypothetical protein